jgi:hypothetical protein
MTKLKMNKLALVTVIEVLSLSSMAILIKNKIYGNIT